MVWLKFDGMKNISKLFTFSIAAIVLGSCGGSNKSTGLEMDPYKRGKYLYEANCESCHRSDGGGVTGSYPPLAKSDYLMADKGHVISAVKNGLRGEVVVNGVTYDQYMPPVGLSKEDIMHVGNYVRNSFGNSTADSIVLGDIEKY